MNEKNGKFIVLKKVKYGESDLIIQALSVDGSKVSFMARSALKSKKRFGGGILEPMHFVNFMYKEPADEAKMKTLVEASLIDDFKLIRADYDRLELAFFVLNAVGRVSLEGDHGSEFLFNITGHTLRAISNSQNNSVLKLHFCLKFLFQQGVVSIDPWMGKYLKVNLSDSHLLQTENECLSDVENYLISIETMVDQYVKTATTD